MGIEYAKKLYVSGLKNAHAMEKQALSIMQPQVNRLTHYPEMSERLQAHISETEGQIARLDEVLGTLDENHSAVKDAMMSTLGTSAALGHVTAGDEVLKNAFANLAFENYEIAAYISLLTTARMVGDASAVPLLEQSLDEERRMADWVAARIPAVTETFITLQDQGKSGKT